MNVRIRIRNKTSYRSDDIRRIVRAAADAVGAKQDKLVTVYTPRNGCTIPRGWGYVGSRRIEAYEISLGIPKPNTALDARCRQLGDTRTIAEEVALVAAHELMHTLGVRHRDMTPEQRTLPPNYLPDWAKGLQLRVKEQAKDASPRPTAEERGAELRAKRHAHARTMLKKATTRRKRAETIEKKWRDKVRYYERQEKQCQNDESPS